ncbi:nitrate/nitrite transporter [Streptomyces roseus]|uniref:MFS transporter n=1 Tax=Streptomyces roseus TaxID=66430 RepID=UPI0036A77749
MGAMIYAVTVLLRSSLGVAGPMAAHRFGIQALQLAVFSTSQLMAYAVMQIPAGVAVDRFGPRRMLLAGLIVMTGGQLGFALVHTFGPALAVRVALGCGDSVIFVSMVRLVAVWFPPRSSPLMMQFTAFAGMLGALASALPMSFVLRATGWTTTFLVTTLIGVITLLLTCGALRDHPAEAAQRTRQTPGVRREVRAGWREPGTRLGFWVHFTCQFPASSFLLLWGFPFLLHGQHVGASTAGALLTLLLLVAGVAGPALGCLIGRRPRLRTPLAVGAAGCTAGIWALVLAWPGPQAPLWLLIFLMLVMGVSGSAAMIGVDFARTHNPDHRLGTATGLVSMGGFCGTAAALVGIGIVLEAATTGDAATALGYSSSAFRAGFVMVVVLLGVGTLQVLRHSRWAADPDS